MSEEQKVAQPAAEPEPEPEFAGEQLAESQFAAWRKQHGEVFEVRTEDERAELVGGRLFVFKAPDKPALSRYLQKAMKSPYDAMGTFIRDLLLHPSVGEFNRIVEAKPGLLVSIGSAVQRETGIGTDFCVRRR